MTRHLLVAALLAGLSTPAAAQTPGAPPTPCATRADNRRFDFWIGEWTVTRRDSGFVVGRSIVTPISGGCALHEQWTDARGGTGHSLNAWNPVTRQWQQFWVGQFGAVTEYRESEWVDGTLRYLARGVSPANKPVLSRLSFTPNADGTVRQHGESSDDDGKTWRTNYDFLYKRVK